MAKVFNFDNQAFELNNFPNPIKLEVDWGRTGDKWASSLHSIASYLAMFAPAMPKFFIENLTSENDLIYDPFSGRGTTALKARELNRKFVGSDLNPYALVLSRAKITHTTKNQLINFIEKIETEFNQWICKNKMIHRRKSFTELRYFYSSTVLKQLIFIRSSYGKNWRHFSHIENLAFGFILGLMHGPIRKDGSTMYFSIDMPNTISMAPNYVRNYSESKNLVKPRLNVFDLIRKRIEKKFDFIVEQKFQSSVFEIDALENNECIENESVKLLITSPPYLSIVDYTNSNWLKLWLLGFERNDLKNEIFLSDNLSYKEYINFITAFLNNVYPKIRSGGHVALIVGDVHGRQLIEEVWNEIRNNVSFTLSKIYWDDKYLQEKKITNMLNKKRGKATTLEKVLLLRK